MNKPIENIFEFKSGKYIISGHWAFYFFSVLGIPSEVLKDWTIKFLQKNGNL